MYVVTVGKRKPTSSSQRKARKEYKNRRERYKFLRMILKILPRNFAVQQFRVYNPRFPIGWPQILHSFLLPTKKEEVHPLAHREYHSLRRIHVKVFSGKDEQP